MIIPMSVETPIPWLRNLMRVPLLGGFVALMFNALPSVLIGVLCAITGTLQTPTIQAVSLALTLAWSGALWFGMQTKVRVLFIPFPLILLVGAGAEIAGV